MQKLLNANEDEQLKALATRALGFGVDAEEANLEIEELMSSWPQSKRRRVARLFADWELEAQLLAQ